MHLFLANPAVHFSSGSQMIATILVIAFIGGIVWLAMYFEKKRAEAMRLAAEGLHLKYHEKGQTMAPEVIGHFYLGSQGHSRGVRNSMSGSAGETEVTIFDYGYTVGHGKNASTQRTTAVRLIGQGPVWPAFEMRPEGIFSKIGAALGGQDIDFESHPQFSKQFVLKGHDEAAVRAFFDETLLSELEARTGFSAEGRGNELLYYRGLKTVKPAEVRGLLEEAHGVFMNFTDAAKRRAVSRQAVRL